MAKHTPTQPTLKPGDLVEQVNPNTGRPYGTATVERVYRQGSGAPTGVRIHRDTGINAVVAPHEIRRK